jgi:acyl-CoA synthetase (AMP-forming)/AMP-acid ligase II
MNFADYLFERSGDSANPFLLESEAVITYRDLSDAVNALASSLSERYGSGNQILLVSENNFFFIVSYLAIIKSGNTAVLVETRIGGRDLADIIDSCSFAACFVQEKFRDILPGTVCDTYTERDTESLVAVRTGFYCTVDPDDSAVIIFTSGSTGAKKGVVLTHKNLVANTESIVEYLRLTQEDRICVVLPFFYCYGASLLHTHIRAGGSIVLNNKVFLGSVIRDINRFNCTINIIKLSKELRIVNIFS